MDAQVRITVLKRLLHKDMLEKYADSHWEPCDRFHEGEEFVSEHLIMPQGFCSWAWSDIEKCVMTLARGGNFLGVKPGTFVTCCTDGFRPVIFGLERVQT